MSTGWGDIGGGSTGPSRRQLRREQRQRDEMNGWWQNQGGEWIRDTPHGDTLDKVLDRIAEDYVNESHYGIDRFLCNVDQALERFGKRYYDSPFEIPAMETILTL